MKAKGNSEDFEYGNGRIMMSLCRIDVVGLTCCKSLELSLNNLYVQTKIICKEIVIRLRAWCYHCSSGLSLIMKANSLIEKMCFESR